jgi:MOSC domain-containing protein YiiM
MHHEKTTVGLVAVNVAEPEIIGKQRGHPVLSAIRKRRVVTDGSLFLTRENLTGDRQADLTVHGGPDKAVYAYPFEHLPLWNAELSPDPPFGPGTFGENLTTSGWREADARIGDVWSWGDAMLQVCQPRFPCYKLAIATGRPDIGKRMLAAGRNGWYLRVLHPGEVPVAGPITVLERGPADATVLDAIRALLPGSPHALTERVAAVDALAASWREALQERLAVRSRDSKSSAE